LAASQPDKSASTSPSFAKHALTSAIEDTGFIAMASIPLFTGGSFRRWPARAGQATDTKQQQTR
jgi:hypothetical protein